MYRTGALSCSAQVLISSVMDRCVFDGVGNGGFGGCGSGSGVIEVFCQRWIDNFALSTTVEAFRSLETGGASVKLDRAFLKTFLRYLCLRDYDLPSLTVSTAKSRVNSPTMTLPWITLVAPSHWLSGVTCRLRAAKGSVRLCRKSLLPLRTMTSSAVAVMPRQKEGGFKQRFKFCRHTEVASSMCPYCSSQL